MRKILAFILCLSICNVYVEAQDLDCNSDKQWYDDNDSTRTPVVCDSLRISLLTCDGYDEVWALYGHTALRIQNVTNGEDYAVNYGLFDFHQPFFPLKFALGHCDYLMGLVPFPIFLQEFEAKGAGVFEQELNLNYDEKLSVLHAIAINNLPENREYRYNFYYDNCASRPRDIVLNNIVRQIEYTNNIDETLTYRQLIHSCNEQQRWCRLGNDLLLGVGSDCRTKRTEQQFLPRNLMRDFATAMLIDSADRKTPLVLRSEWVLPRVPSVVHPILPIPPVGFSALLFLIVLLFSIIEWQRKRNYWLLDAILLAVAGIIGLLLFLMLFSEHPTVRLNLQILVYNPLICFFWWKVVTSTKRKDSKAKIFLAAYSVFCIFALFGGLIQDYSEGFYWITLAIIIRLLSRIVLKH